MNTSKNVSNISQVKWGNTSSNDPAGMAEIFYKYFSSIGNNLSQNFPPSNKQFNEFLDAPIPRSIFLAPTYKQEIMKIVSDLKL